MTSPTIRLLLRPHHDKPNGRPVKLGRFAAYLENELICISHQPLFDGARELLLRGLDPATLLTTRHEGNDYDNFVPAPIGRLAGLTVIENDSGLHLRPYVPWTSQVADGMRESAAEVPGQPPDHNAPDQAESVPLAAE